MSRSLLQVMVDAASRGFEVSFMKDTYPNYRLTLSKKLKNGGLYVLVQMIPGDHHLDNTVEVYEWMLDKAISQPDE